MVVVFAMWFLAFVAPPDEGVTKRDGSTLLNTLPETLPGEDLSADPEPPGRGTARRQDFGFIPRQRKTNAPKRPGSRPWP